MNAFLSAILIIRIFLIGPIIIAKLDASWFTCCRIYPKPNTVKDLSDEWRGIKKRITLFIFPKYQESHYISGNYPGKLKTTFAGIFFFYFIIQVLIFFINDFPVQFPDDSWQLIRTINQTLLSILK